MNSIAESIKKLKGSPLFYLFLSSRELFHSNFWFWLSTLNKIEASRLFSEKSVSDEINFKREHNQSNDIPNQERVKSKVDLLLYEVEELLEKNKLKKEIRPSVVIENKVKDFPTAGQLERIRLSFGEKSDNIDYVLATLFWRNDFKEHVASGWNVKTYREIAEGIDSGKFTNNNYYRELINDYKTFTLNLSELAEQLPIGAVYDFFYPVCEYSEVLNSINLWEVYQKFRASHMLMQFSKLENLQNVSTLYSINNQKATIDFRPLPQLNSYGVGIQIEGNQYRKFVEGKNAGAFASNLINNGLFLDPPNGKYNRGASYLNYGAAFKYQYEKIEEALPFADLFKKIEKDVEFILKHEQEIKKQIP